MLLKTFWPWLEATPIAQYVASSSWAFPTFESIHVMAIVTVVGSVAVMDLRLLGLASTETSVTQMSRDTLRWTWAAFVLAMITGGLLFMAKATNYIANPFFLWKMVLIAVAGLNMAVFHFFTWRNVAEWDADGKPPRAAQVAGGMSVALWVVVVFVARAIGFTLDKFSS